MQECKFCSNKKLIKNGRVRGVQRYRCTECRKNQIPGDARVKYTTGCEV